MNKHPHVAVVGATGAVGIEMIKTLEKRNFPVGKLTLLASARSVGKKLKFKGTDVTVTELTKDSFAGIDIALFSAGGGISKEFYLPYFRHIRDIIIDKGLSNKVLMTGFVPEGDADALFRLCDFVVLPYTQVVGNASACDLAIGYQKPIIASNLSPFSEEIEDGQHGVLCQPHDSHQILDAMEKLSSDSGFYLKTCTNLGGLEAARDWQTVAEYSLKLYKEILLRHH